MVVHLDLHEKLRLIVVDSYGTIDYIIHSRDTEWLQSFSHFGGTRPRLRDSRHRLELWRAEARLVLEDQPQWANPRFRSTFPPIPNFTMF